MEFNKQDALKRCKEKHETTGRIYKMFERVLKASYPKGTNLVLAVMDELVNMGLPYVATNMDIDKGADCAEVWRVVFYWFFGKDIGNYTQAQWNDNDVILRFDDRKDLRVLDLIYFNFKAGRKVSHVGGYVGGKQMIHTTQISGNHDLRYDSIYKYSDKYYVGCVRFITNKELASVIVGGEINKNESEDNDMIIKGDPRKELVADIQGKLVSLGYDLGGYGNNKDGIDGEYGGKTFWAVEKFQNDCSITVNDDTKGYVTAETALVLSNMSNKLSSAAIEKLKQIKAIVA